VRIEIVSSCRFNFIFFSTDILILVCTMPVYPVSLNVNFNLAVRDRLRNYFSFSFIRVWGLALTITCSIVCINFKTLHSFWVCCTLQIEF
jgi:membrane-bound metal-dependent hydrolase YbcI (DUF457 family)